LASPGLELQPLDLQPVVSRYTDYAIPALYIYVYIYIKIGSAIEKLIEGMKRHTDAWIHRQHVDRISLYLFFKIRKLGLKYK
jgi:hypothetical protein